jgi:predicted aspartyl protease
MHDEMGTFRVDIEIENPARPGERQLVRSALVDTGAELSWIPATALESLAIRPYKTWRFRQADGTVLERSIGATQQANSMWLGHRLCESKPACLPFNYLPASV